MKRIVLALFVCVSACASSQKRADPAPPVATEVARVNGRMLRSDALDVHAKNTGLARPAALDDLIDIELVRAAAERAAIPTPPGEWSENDRATAERLVAENLKLEIPPGADTLIVDHAWVKDSPKKKQKLADRRRLEKLRGLVIGGMHIPDAYKELAIPGVEWHIGDHEEYPYTVVPAAARDLEVGSVSELIVGDGGLHLFQIYEHKKTPPPADKVRAILREKLRKDATIIQMT